MTAIKLIREHITKLPAGKPFATASLLQYASRANVDQIISRLVKSGELERIARGIVIKPRALASLGSVPPKPLQIAKTVAEKTGEVIALHGAEAARQLQLTTQVPTTPVFYTTGVSRTIKTNNTEIKLIHISPRKLVAQGSLVGLVISALWYLGKAYTTQAVIKKLQKNLTEEQFLTIIKSRSLMPGWMSDTFYRYQQEHHHA